MNFTVIVVVLARLGYVTYKAYSSILSPGVINERVDCLALDNIACVKSLLCVVG
jgi:hypothetical protein